MFAKGNSQIDKESLKAAMRELGTRFFASQDVIHRFSGLPCGFRLGRWMTSTKLTLISPCRPQAHR